MRKESTFILLLFYNLVQNFQSLQALPTLVGNALTGQTRINTNNYEETQDFGKELSSRQNSRAKRHYFEGFKKNQEFQEEDHRRDGLIYENNYLDGEEREKKLEKCTAEGGCPAFSSQSKSQTSSSGVSSADSRSRSHSSTYGSSSSSSSSSSSRLPRVLDHRSRLPIRSVEKIEYQRPWCPGSSLASLIKYAYSPIYDWRLPETCAQFAQDFGGLSVLVGVYGSHDLCSAASSAQKTIVFSNYTIIRSLSINEPIFASVQTTSGPDYATAAGPIFYPDGQIYYMAIAKQVDFLPQIC